jgi:hypothetical protein
MALLSRSTALDAPDGSALVKIKDGVYIGSITGTLTLGPTYPNEIKIDPTGGHRDVTLDAVATNAGLRRTIVNGADAAENLVVKNVGGDTIGTINQNEEGHFFCDGATWVLVKIVAIALS